jgi:hypothetical protein
MLRIREVPGLNLGPETGYPVWGFSCFSSVRPGNYQDIPENQANTASSHVRPNSSFTEHPFVRRYVVCYWKGVVK